jgi:prepilin-type N-terminal cleavage/methylation domain-containing protein
MIERWRGPRGYTVIELLIVITIIAALAGITYVRMAPALARARVRGAASALAGDLQYAQVLAARLRVPVRISVNSAGLSYQIADRSGATVYRARVLGTGGEFALNELSATPAAIDVFPNAVATQGATYTLGLNGYRRRVTFSRAGQIRVTTVP